MTKITIDLGNSIGIIHPNIYGHFAEHIGGVMEDGLWVGEESTVENIRGFRKKLVESFKKINPPILRWPGGCFAETYDWRDGIGPREKRPVRVNWWYYHDGRLEKRLRPGSFHHCRYHGKGQQSHRRIRCRSQ